MSENSADQMTDPEMPGRLSVQRRFPPTRPVPLELPAYGFWLGRPAWKTRFRRMRHNNRILRSHRSSNKHDAELRSTFFKAVIANIWCPPARNCPIASLTIDHCCAKGLASDSPGTGYWCTQGFNSKVICGCRLSDNRNVET
jgi:hypothetical protein